MQPHGNQLRRVRLRPLALAFFEWICIDVYHADAAPCRTCDITRDDILEKHHATELTLRTPRDTRNRIETLQTVIGKTQDAPHSTDLTALTNAPARSLLENERGGFATRTDVKNARKNLGVKVPSSAFQTEPKLRAEMNMHELTGFETLHMDKLGNAKVRACG